jgi:outer membrane protein assembly factor BamB
MGGLRVSRRTVWPFVLAACGAAIASCQDPTEVSVRLSTDVPCQAFNGVTVTIGNVSSVETKPSATTSTSCTAGDLGDLTVVPSGSDSDEVTIKIVGGVGRDPESCTAPNYGVGCIVARRTLRYVAHTPLHLTIALRSSCNGVACEEGQTCLDGACTSASIDSGKCRDGCGDSVLGPGGPIVAPSPLVCGDSSGLQSGSPWPMLGGCPTHIGRSPYVSAQTNTVKWSTVVGGSITTGVSIGADGTLYSGAADHKLYAVDAQGSVKWGAALGSTFGALVPAIAADGTIYSGNDDTNLYAVSAAGAVRWTYPVGGTVFTSANVAGDGTVYVGGGTNSHAMVAVNKDGTLRWTFATGNDVLSSPALGFNGTAFVGCEDNQLYAVDPTGKQTWQYNVGEGSQTPVVGIDGTLYFAGKDSVCAVDGQGNLKWVTQTQNDASTPSIGADGTVYAVDSKGNLAAYEPTKGTPIWSTPLSDVDTSNQVVVGGDGTLYVGSTTGAFYAVSPTGSVKWTLMTGDAIHGPAAIGADGTLYFGSDKLYAVGP